MIRTFALLSLSILTLAGCTSTPQDSTILPQLTYDHLVTIPLNVSRIEMTSETQRGAQAWDIANNLPTPPDMALRRYLEQRFKASGAHGVLQVTLNKAHIQVDDTANENKLLSFIPLANNQDYTFEVVIDLNNQYQSGLPDTKTSTRFVRKTKMPLNATMSYRDARLQRTLEELIRDIDEAMISTFSNQFNILSDKNIPQKTMFIKTIVPDNARQVDEIWSDVKGSLIGGSDEFKAKKEAEEKALEEAKRNPQLITPE
jgi:hypothetical protein